MSVDLPESSLFLLLMFPLGSVSGGRPRMPLMEYEPGRWRGESWEGAWVMTEVAADTGDSVPGRPCFAFSAALFRTILWDRRYQVV